ncbi:FkbM family methyltransferase (plasmid) [Streptomyces sp. NBC_00440]|uniref:FkbM family methyltransferase n=1 Tax=unclassified Streptomyces TaxID=2593676 RepID=UPI002E2397F9|nr:FkbM family methyltransferase [Streptomyces sp. NBC_00963]
MIEGLNRDETTQLYEEIFIRRTYLSGGIELDAENLVVFDVGANIGMFSLFVTSLCPTASVYAFEPMPPIFEKLRQNTGQLGTDVKLFDYGLSDRAQRIPFTYYPGFSTMSVQRAYADTAAERSLVRQSMIRAGAAPGTGLDVYLDEMLDYRLREESHECRVRRMSDVVDEHSVERIDVLKIDVQRAEADVLRGIEERHWKLIRQIAMEVHDEPGTLTEGRLAETSAELRQRGFSVGTEQEAELAGTDRYMLSATRR